ncbi:hypothetical protein HNY73_013584 [Argiope bruennichi]|uniref:Uncharacterized protein n=1 Tax=Argiope bruennichi TaxID=94029 RepID=A0A8T0F0B8_ARGBR|nr:hypothetical protein HNY73_013584 [Argiope bruennichi]
MLLTKSLLQKYSDMNRPTADVCSGLQSPYCRCMQWTAIALLQMYAVDCNRPTADVCSGLQSPYCRCMQWTAIALLQMPYSSGSRGIHCCIETGLLCLSPVSTTVHSLHLFQ